MKAAALRQMIKARRARADYLPADLFRDPAWDMLLDLMAARLEGRKVAVSDLCFAGFAPFSTGLRYVGMLAERGLVERTADPDDGRRVHVELTDSAASALEAWLERFGPGSMNAAALPSARRLRWGLTWHIQCAIRVSPRN